MKWKLLRQRLSIAAPRMTIRRHRPWWVQVGWWIIILGLSGALALWTYDLGRQIAGLGTGLSKNKSTAASQLSLEQRLTRLQQERDELAAQNSAAQSNLAIERATLQKLMAQVKALETENSQLHEDLLFYERIAPASGKAGVSIRTFSAQQESQVSGVTMHYRLLVSQGGKTERDFVGTVRFQATLLKNGRTEVVAVPEANAVQDATFSLAFRTLQRVEGRFTLPAGVQVKSVQAQILENGVVRAQQSVPLP
jgi:hypothetical protein